MEVFGYAPWGYVGDLVKVEVDLRPGIPGMEIVGLPGGAVREAKDRIRIALKRSGFEFPTGRILINLSPADLAKTGSGYDLPMALAILHVSGQCLSPTKSLLAMGELSLDGGIRRVPGVLGAGICCMEANLEAFAVSSEAHSEATCLAGITLRCASTLADIVRSLGQSSFPSLPEPVLNPPSQQEQSWEWRGHPHVLKSLEVAAAGGHSALFYGPPGGGKSLAARNLQSLLSPLPPQAALETTRLWSLAGILARDQGLVRSRPFRSPHHHASAEGLLGGGRSVLPGEVSLAHHGVLFLDEAPEFASRVLQSLREPLEQGTVSVTRAGRTAWFPCRFQLIMTANACPCGQTGKDHGVCFCSGLEIRRYWDRVGTALMDRVDLRVFVTPESPENLLSSPRADPEVHRTRIARATQMQQSRGQDPLTPNAALSPALLSRYCTLEPAERKTLAEASRKNDWSSRAIHSLLRVSRSVADLEGSPRINAQHLEAAISLRKPRGEEYWER